MNNMLHFWSPFLKIKRRAVEIFSTILVLDTNSLQIFFEINEKKERPDDWRIAKSPLQSRLFKFKSHPHDVFAVWHLLKSHYEKWVQKIPEALRHLGFLLWHLFRIHNMVAQVGFLPLAALAFPRRIVVCRRLRLLGSAYSLLCGVSLRENDTQSFSLAHPLPPPEVVVAIQNLASKASKKAPCWVPTKSC